MLGGAYGVMGSESAADLSSPEGGRNTSLGGVAMPQGRMFESKKKRSQEVTRLLGAVKTQFGKFGEIRLLYNFFGRPYQ